MLSRVCGFLTPLLSRAVVVPCSQVRGQCPKVAKQDKKKAPKGRAGKRITVSKPPRGSRETIDGVSGCVNYSRVAALSGFWEGRNAAFLSV